MTDDHKLDEDGEYTVKYKNSGNKKKGTLTESLEERRSICQCRDYCKFYFLAVTHRLGHGGRKAPASMASQVQVST